jgi:hypothetical protein
MPHNVALRRHSQITLIHKGEAAAGRLHRCDTSSSQFNDTSPSRHFLSIGESTDLGRICAFC